MREQLLAEGWRIAEVWECTLKGRERLPLAEVLAACDGFLRSEDRFCSIGADRHVGVAGGR